MSTKSPHPHQRLDCVLLVFQLEEVLDTGQPVILKLQPIPGNLPRIYMCVVRW